MTAERRHEHRRRTLAPATLHFSSQGTTMSGCVRNLSEDGARLQMDEAHWVPDHFEIDVPLQKLHARAHVVWRDAQGLGIAFEDSAPAFHANDHKDSIPVLKARIARLERENAALTLRVKQMTDEL